MLRSFPEELKVAQKFELLRKSLLGVSSQRQDRPAVLSEDEPTDTVFTVGRDAVATELHQPVDEIGQLYDEIADLASSVNARSDSELEKKIESRWTRLRRLQAEEADRFEAAFMASLAMPLDAGSRITEDARALREEVRDHGLTPGATTTSRAGGLRSPKGDMR